MSTRVHTCATPRLARAPMRPGALVMTLGVALGVLLLGGCREEAAASYTVRGAIENLTVAQGRPVALIRHEAIPDFVDGYGKRRTMQSMAMAFGIADGVSLDGLAIGDKVEVSFVIDRERYPTFHVTALRELPAGTALTLSP